MQATRSESSFARARRHRRGPPPARLDHDCPIELLRNRACPATPILRASLLIDAFHLFRRITRPLTLSAGLVYEGKQRWIMNETGSGRERQGEAQELSARREMVAALLGGLGAAA